MNDSRSTSVTARRPSPCKEAAREHVHEHIHEHVHEHAAPGKAKHKSAGRASADTKFKLSPNVVFPLLGGRSTLSHEHLLPIFVSLIVALALMAVPFPWLRLTMDSGKAAPPGINEAWQVFTIIAIFTAFLINYYINQMCGRARSGFLQAFVSVVTFWLLTSWFWDFWYGLFYFLIPGQELEKSSNPLAVIAGDIFGTGLCEEGLKALPLLALAALTLAFGRLGHRIKGWPSALLSSLTQHFGLREPLDGIVLGAASGSGFFIYETLIQYVPQVLGNGNYTGDSAFNGLVTLLARGIPELTAHSAYSGLFGYFIGLSVLLPRMAVFLIPLGWLGASVLHGAWDATSDLANSGVINEPVQIIIQVIIGVLSYALLAGAIFKARDISPSYRKRRARLTTRLAPRPCSSWRTA